MGRSTRYPHVQKSGDDGEMGGDPSGVRPDAFTDVDVSELVRSSSALL